MFDPFAQQLKLAFVPISRETKTPYHKGWTTRDFTPDDFAPDDNIGAKWGEPSNNLVDIDCDTVEACRITKGSIKVGPVYGRKSNRSSHFIVRCKGAKTKRYINPLTNKTIIEIRSTGGQSVLPGSIHPSGEDYEWERKESPGEVDTTKLSKVIGQIAAASLVSTIWQPGKTRHALALALAGFFAKNGLPIDDARSVFEMILNGAEDDKEGDREKCLEDTYQNLEDGERITSNFEEWIKEGATTFARTLAKWLGMKLKRGVTILNLEELCSRPVPPYLIDGFITAGGFVQVVGQPGVGKTFLALDIGMSIASGQKQFLSRDVNKHGPVLYVIAEGIGRFQYRIRKWCNEHGKKIKDIEFFSIPESINLRDHSLVAELKRQLKALKPLLIVIDTLPRCSGGAEENSATDMGEVINVCDNFRLQEGATVMTLHHPTKKESDNHGRGSGAVFGALDTEIQVSVLGDRQKDGTVRMLIRCGKQKDDESFDDFEVMRRVGPVLNEDDQEMADDFGKPLSSCWLELPGKEDERDLGLRIINRLRDHPGEVSEEIRKALGVRKADVIAKLKKLVDDKQVTEQRAGKGKLLYRVSDAGLPY